MSLNNFNPLLIAMSLMSHRYLIGQLTRRDVLLKYRGSYIGIGWSFLYPLLLLGAFTFVFEKIIGVHGGGGKAIPVAFIIYCGLIVFNIFSEVVGAAPRLILGYQSYVKKIIFPVEILPVTLVASACIHAAINLLILFLALAFFGELHVTFFWAPLVLVPMLLFVLGIAWLTAAAGVFVRDLVHVIPVFIQIFMFLSPVFYAVKVVPEYWQWLYSFNPVGVVIEDLRRVTLWGESPDWKSWSAILVISLFVALIGYAFFQRSKEEFADVI